MGVQLESFLSRLAVLFAIVVCAALAPAELHSSSVVELEQKATYTLQVNDAIAAVELVTALGGAVDSSVTMLNVLQVQLSDEQLRLVSVSPLVERIADGAADAGSTKAQVAGRIWLK